jgi:hypothetical protein
MIPESKNLIAESNVKINDIPFKIIPASNLEEKFT